MSLWTPAESDSAGGESHARRHMSERRRAKASEGEAGLLVRRELQGPEESLRWRATGEWRTTRYIARFRVRGSLESLENRPEHAGFVGDTHLAA